MNGGGVGRRDGGQADRSPSCRALLLALAAAWLGAVLSLAGLQPVLAQPKRVALVIGNAAYEKTAPLANPANDASDLAAKLTALGFTVTLRLDATKPVLDRALLEFARAAAAADVALFYFAGHGMQYEGRNYLLPIDAKIDDDLDVRFQLFALDDVRTALDRLPAARIIILDACRNNPLADQFARSVAGTTREAGAVRGLARLPQGQGGLVAFATQPDQVARDGEGRNSPFTKALLRHIADEGAEIGAVFRRVAASVNQDTGGRQTPEVMISLLRDVYLKPEPEDSAAWRTVQFSRDPAALEEFIARFPDSVHVEGARAFLDYLKQTARLAPPAGAPAAAGKPVAPAPPAGKEVEQAALGRAPVAALTPRVLAQLTRIGCYRGPADADWTAPAVQRSLQLFARRDRSRLPAAPTPGLLEALSGKDGGFCDPLCGPGTTLRGGRCVAKAAPTPRRARAPEQAAPVKDAGGGKCFVFNGQQYCQ